MRGNQQNATKSKGESQKMNAFLESCGLVRKEIPKDGACLFRAVSEQIYGTQEHHLRVRKICIDTLRKHKDKFNSFIHDIPFDHYVEEMSKPFAWGGHVELTALSLSFSVNFKIYTIPNQVINIDNTAVPQGTLLLCYIGGNHYDNVYTLQQWNLMQSFQSYIYTIAKNALPELEIEIPSSYKNIGLEEWKRGGTTLRSSDMAFCKKIQNQEKKLSGYYRKTSQQQQQQNKKQYDSSKNNHKRTKQRQKGQIVIPTIKNSVDTVRDHNINSDPEITEEMINTEAFFPSLSGSKPQNSSTSGATKVSGAWGKPINLSATATKPSEAEPTVKINATQSTTTDIQPDNQTEDTKTHNETKTNDDIDIATTKQEEKQPIIEEEKPTENEDFVNFVPIPFGSFSVEQIRNIMQNPASGVKINFVEPVRYIYKPETKETNAPESPECPETTGFIPENTQTTPTVFTPNTMIPHDSTMMIHDPMVHPHYHYPSYPMHYTPGAEVYYFPVYSPYVPQNWYHNS